MIRKINAVEHGSPPLKLFHSGVEISTRLGRVDQVAACRGVEIAVEVSPESFRLKPAGQVVLSTRSDISAAQSKYFVSFDALIPRDFRRPCSRRPGFSEVTRS